MTLQNDLFLRAAKGETTERTPVWLMRQAGRILPEYRAVRAKLKDFKELVSSPAFAAEVTVQPVDLLGVDAAIIFSKEAKGPYFPSPIRHEADLAKIRIADPVADLGYVLEAIRLTKKELNGRVPLIGFAGAPFTIFAYIVEGSGSKTFSVARRMMYENPVLSHQILQKITDSTILYLKAQIEAGADLVQIFDSWAGILTPAHYEIFSLPYIKQICDSVQTAPKTVFAKGAFFARKSLATLDCQVLGLDWNMDIAESRELIGKEKTLQGNLDPCALYGSFADIKNETEKMLREFGKNRHIANLGHGVYPDTDPDKVRCFIDTVRNFKG